MEERIEIDGKQKLLVVLAHISYFFGGLGFVLAPLLIYLLWDKDEFVRFHAKQALVCHVFLLVAGGVTGILCAVLIGILLIPVLIVIGVVFFVASIIGAWRGYHGEYYRYPFIQGFVGLFN